MIYTSTLFEFAVLYDAIVLGIVLSLAMVYLTKKLNEKD